MSLNKGMSDDEKTVNLDQIPDSKPHEQSEVAQEHLLAEKENLVGDVDVKPEGAEEALRNRDVDQQSSETSSSSASDEENSSESSSSDSSGESESLSSAESSEHSSQSSEAKSSFNSSSSDESKKKKKKHKHMRGGMWMQTSDTRKDDDETPFEPGTKFGVIRYITHDLPRNEATLVVVRNRQEENVSVNAKTIIERPKSAGDLFDLAPNQTISYETDPKFHAIRIKVVAGVWNGLIEKVKRNPDGTVTAVGAHYPLESKKKS